MPVRVLRTNAREVKNAFVQKLTHHGLENESFLSLFSVMQVIDFFGGQGEIRTHDTELPYTGFRVRRIRPLCHLSRGGSPDANRIWRLPATCFRAPLRIWHGPVPGSVVADTGRKTEALHSSTGNGQDGRRRGKRRSIGAPVRESLGITMTARHLCQVTILL